MMQQSGRGNIEKLLNITTELKNYSETYDELLEEIVLNLEKIKILNKSIKRTMLDNELVGARKVAEFDSRVRNSFTRLIEDDSIEVLRSFLEEASLDLKDLDNYYRKHYLQTVSKQEALRR